MSNEQQGCTEKTVQVSENDLPLSCPLPDQRLWDAHPRIYLPIETTGEYDCPYCGVHYSLADSAKQST